MISSFFIGNHNLTNFQLTIFTTAIGLYLVVIITIAMCNKKVAKWQANHCCENDQAGSSKKCWVGTRGVTFATYPFE